MNNYLHPFQKSRQVREPLRTVSEIAEEFEVPTNALINFLRWQNGPKPQLIVGKRGYYVPSEVRKWWSGVQR